MSTPKQLVGSAQVVADGIVLNTLPGATLYPGGKKRTAVMAGGTVVGFTEEPVASKLECQYPVSADTSIKAVGAIKGATITFKCDTGQVYVIAGGWCVEPNELASKDGSAKATFEGPEAEEML